MKLNFSEFKPIIKKISKPSRVLTLLFISVLLVEAYLLYYQVYGNLSTGVEEEITVDKNVVHLDLINYKKVLDVLDLNKNFTSNIPADLRNSFK